MGWSSRDNNLRRNRKPVPVPVNIAPKTPVNKIAAQPVSTDLSILDGRSAKNVATLHDKVQEIFRNWIAECQVLAKAQYLTLQISVSRSQRSRAKRKRRHYRISRQTWQSFILY